MIPVHQEHGELVATWHRLGYRKEIVVCFDRHLDLKPIRPSHLDALERADSVSELAGLNRPLPMRGVPGSYGLDDFYAAGAALGHVEELHWVMAEDGPDTPSVRAAILGAVAQVRAEREVLERTRFSSSGALVTELCGLRLHVHTPRSFARTVVPSAARVDIDLDWFADVGPGAQHEVEELLRLVEIHGLARSVDSFTYSIRSGFLPPEKRPLAEALAARLGQHPEDVPSTVAPLPEATFAAIRAGGPGDPRELNGLGPVGIVLGGLVQLRAGHVDAAEQAWWDAAQHGTEATWLSYQLGIRALQERDYSRAHTWLTRASPDGFDTLEARARLLVAVADLRLERPEAALDRLADVVGLYPFYERAVSLLVATARRLGSPVPGEILEQREALTRLINQGEPDA